MQSAKAAFCFDPFLRNLLQGMYALQKQFFGEGCLFRDPLLNSNREACCTAPTVWVVPKQVCLDAVSHIPFAVGRGFEACLIFLGYLKGGVRVTWRLLTGCEQKRKRDPNKGTYSLVLLDKDGVTLNSLNILLFHILSLSFPYKTSISPWFLF